MNNLRNHLSTVFGAIVALSTAWITIDWSAGFTRDNIIKATLSGLIAIGGYMTSINPAKKKVKAPFKELP